MNELRWADIVAMVRKEAAQLPNAPECEACLKLLLLPVEELPAGNWSVTWRQVTAGGEQRCKFAAACMAAEDYLHAADWMRFVLDTRLTVEDNERES